MATRKIDPTLAEILKKFGADPATDIWDCHGTWVAYHRALERIAVKADITFDAPQVLEANGGTKTVAICVNGHLGARSEWSIGEAAPGNNKNAYPYAMAEKRAKDRVILKLIGLHGLVYSEEEFETGAPPQKQDNTALDSKALTNDLIAECAAIKNLRALETWGANLKERVTALSEDDVKRVRNEYGAQHKALKNAEALAA
jgi:hypothetical protein